MIKNKINQIKQKYNDLLYETLFALAPRKSNYYDNRLFEPFLD